jgi:mono/diheme cytochrome c family protein
VGPDYSSLTVKTLVIAAAAMVATASAAQAQGSDIKAASAGVYKEEQAIRGDTVFQRTCLSCHTPTFHADEQFRMNWLGRTVYELFKLLKTTMPEDNIGGLTDDDYTRVIAYILKLNGYPAGADSLSADSLAQKRIRIGSDSSAAKPPGGR